MDSRRSPAQIGALVLGIWWIVNGVGALLLDPNLATSDVHGGGNVLGVVSVTANGWHAVFHLLPGLLGVAVWTRPRASLAYMLGAGAVYIVLGTWGLLAGGSALGPIAVDASGDVVHIAEGQLAWIAGGATLQEQRTAATPARA